jgi:hypothetical protein
MCFLLYGKESSVESLEGNTHIQKKEAKEKPGVDVWHTPTIFGTSELYDDNLGLKAKPQSK